MMTMITKNWRVVFRDTLGNERLIAFCQDMAEGKKIMARLYDDQQLENLKGELSLKAVNPEWITNPVKTDYCHYVRALIPDKEWKRVTGLDVPDDMNKFMNGDMRAYYMLSKMIPTAYTVINFGCGANAQSYLFTQHKQFIAVDPQKMAFRAVGSRYYQMTAGEFINNQLPQLNLNMQRTFAICCNITGKNNENPGLLVRINFLNMFTINNYKHI